MADSKPVKQEVNGTVILPPLVFPGSIIPLDIARSSINSVTTELDNNLQHSVKKCSALQWKSAYL
jgi:hypothetical protein